MWERKNRGREKRREERSVTERIEEAQKGEERRDEERNGDDEKLSKIVEIKRRDWERKFENKELERNSSIAEESNCITVCVNHMCRSRLEYVIHKKI